MKKSLADPLVVHDFVGHFANDVMLAYSDFLAGKRLGDEVKQQIEGYVAEYGAAFMGRDPRYEIAPWQGVKLRRRLLGYLPKMHVSDDPGEALFRDLALDCIKCSMALADGYSDEEVGAGLKRTLDDTRNLILGVL